MAKRQCSNCGFWEKYGKALIMSRPAGLCFRQLEEGEKKFKRSIALSADNYHCHFIKPVLRYGTMDVGRTILYQSLQDSGSKGKGPEMFFIHRCHGIEGFYCNRVEVTIGNKKTWKKISLVWKQAESRGVARFTDGICPDCNKKFKKSIKGVNKDLRTIQRITKAKE